MNRGGLITESCIFSLFCFLECFSVRVVVLVFRSLIARLVGYRFLVGAGLSMER